MCQGRACEWPNINVTDVKLQQPASERHMRAKQIKRSEACADKKKKKDMWCIRLRLASPSPAI
jgi:hypothetical protein